MTTVSVRCVGLPVEIHDREAPVEYDFTEPCGWTGTAELSDWCVCGDSVRIANAMPDGCPDCHGVLEIDREIQGGVAKAATDDGTPAVTEVEALADMAGAGVDVTGPAEATPPAPAGPPDLHHAIQAAADALDHQPVVAATTGWRWWRPQDVARIAVEAAAPHLGADLQRRLEQATAEVERLRKVREALRKVDEHPYDFEAASDLDEALQELDALDLAAAATPEVGDG